MSRRNDRIHLTASLSLAALALVGLMVANTWAAGSTELAGASLSLESEMRETIWQGPMFDLLFGLAIGASAAALIRVFRIFAGRRSPA